MQARVPFVYALNASVVTVVPGPRGLQLQGMFMTAAQPHTARRAYSARTRRLWACLLVIGISPSFIGCAELRGRHEARRGNDLFRDGDYAAAVAAYEESQRIFPEFPTSALNMGLACRQMMSLGGDDPQSVRAADCALEQFKRYQELVPEDERGAQLFEQTLFDANRYEELEKMYLEQFQKNPKDMLAVNALVQVYTRWGKWDKSLEWELKRAELAPDDPDAHYSIGALIFNRLFEKGGGGLATRFDPRPGAVNAWIAEKYPDLPPGEVPPFFTTNDIVGEKRVQLADLGLKHLERALELRSDYSEAMVIAGLLHRQKALAYLSEPEEWQQSIEKAEEWRKRAATQQNQQQTGGTPGANEGSVKAEENGAQDENRGADGTGPGTANPASGSAQE